MLNKYFMKLLLFLISTLLISKAYSQNNFYKSFDTYGPVKVIATDDGGYVAATFKGLLKLDSSLNLVFYNEQNSDTIVSIRDITQTSDGGYILVSAQDPYNSDGIGIVMKFDENGVLSWSKRYYGSTVDEVWKISSSADNGFLMFFSGCSGGLEIMKCDEFGNIIWQKTTEYNTNISNILRPDDQHYLLIGTTLTNELKRNITIYKIDSAGNSIWMKDIKTDAITIFINDAKLEDKAGFSILPIIIEDTISANRHSVHFFLDSLGNVIKAYKIHTNENIHMHQLVGFHKTNDGGYIYLGQLFLGSGQGRTTYLKTDSLNNVKWMRYFGNISANDWGANTGINIISGNNCSYLFMNNPDGFSIAKIDSLGEGFCNYESMQFYSEEKSFLSIDTNTIFTDLHFSCQNFLREMLFSEPEEIIYCTDVSLNNKEIDKKDDYRIYPNPTTEKIFLSENFNNANYQIISLLGAVVKSGVINNDMIDLSELKPGIYILNIGENNTEVMVKIVKN